MLTSIALITCLAAAAEPHDSADLEHHAGADPHAQHNIVALHGHTGALSHDGHTVMLESIGGFYERVLVGHLEGEVAVSYTTSPDGNEVPVKLLLKRGAQLGERVTVSPGLGGMMVAVLGDETRYVPGLAANTDVYLWMDEHMGVLFEVDGAVGFGAYSLAEIEAGTGLAVRF